MFTSANPFVEAFERFQAGRAAEPEWLQRLRRQAFERFGELGVPTLRQEDWKYTNPAPLAQPDYDVAADPAAAGITPALAAALGLADFTGLTLVFVDGVFAPALSKLRAAPPAGCVVTNLAAALRLQPDLVQTHLANHADHERHVFASLNLAFAADGAFVYAPAGSHIAEPVHALFIASGRKNVMSHPRNLVIADAGAALTFVEHYVSLDDAASIVNTVTGIAAGVNAGVQHVQVQRQGAAARFVETLHATLLRDARLGSQSVTLGAGLARNDYAVVLDGENAAVNLDGLYMAAGKQHVDYHTTITHARAHGTSRELFKGIVADRAVGVFNGRIVVPPASQKTDSEQGIHSLLLSREATVNAKPELEIFADDVKCAHGATVGQLDEQAVFYLRARGLDREAARALLTHAFANDILDRVPVEALRAALHTLTAAWLPLNEERGA
jgi:Fe-S cluster assembly protein SufD